jgi:hypothetical protein
LDEVEGNWLVEVSFICPGEDEETITEHYYQARAPQRSDVISDLVPKGATTTNIHISKA